MNKLKCKICGKVFRHLGSHVWHKHKMLSREYKMEFGLPINFCLTDEKIRSKHVADNRKYFAQNMKNLTSAGEKYRFKPGENKFKVGKYISPITRHMAIQNLAKYCRSKKIEKCPVCNMKFKSLDSHLYNEHKLLRVKPKYETKRIFR